MSNAAKVIPGTRPLTAEEREKLSHNIYYNDPTVGLRAARFAREQAYLERHGRLPAVFETVQTKVKRAKTLREQLIEAGKLKSKA